MPFQPAPDETHDPKLTTTSAVELIDDVEVLASTSPAIPRGMSSASSLPLSETIRNTRMNMKDINEAVGSAPRRRQSAASKASLPGFAPSHFPPYAINASLENLPPGFQPFSTTVLEPQSNTTQVPPSHPLPGRGLRQNSSGRQTYVDNMVPQHQPRSSPVRPPRRYSIYAPAPPRGETYPPRMPSTAYEEHNQPDTSPGSRPVDLPTPRRRGSASQYADGASTPYIRSHPGTPHSLPVDKQYARSAFSAGAASPYANKALYTLTHI